MLDKNSPAVAEIERMVAEMKQLTAEIEELDREIAMIDKLMYLCVVLAGLGTGWLIWLAMELIK